MASINEALVAYVSEKKIDGKAFLRLGSHDQDIKDFLLWVKTNRKQIDTIAIMLHLLVCLQNIRNSQIGKLQRYIESELARRQSNNLRRGGA